MNSKDNCFECGNNAHHLHHVVPKSKGGTVMIPLCVPCHSKVHGKEMQIPYLTRLALMKKLPEMPCFIFWAYFVEGKSTTDIYKELLADGYSVMQRHIRKTINRIEKISIDDLLDIFEPILKLAGNEFYTREYVASCYESQIFLKNSFR